MGIRHFSDIYKAPIGITLPSIIRTAEALPRFGDLDEVENLNSRVSREELEAVLKCFKKDKSTGLDGWLTEFYSSFFELIGDNLLQTIEECRRSGRMLVAFNSTFLAFIPKTDNPSSFDDYWPISLYKNIYKIISKKISLRIKPILS